MSDSVGAGQFCWPWAGNDLTHTPGLQLGSRKELAGWVSPRIEGTAEGVFRAMCIRAMCIRAGGIRRYSVLHWPLWCWKGFDN